MINRGAPGNQITLVNQEYLEILNLECVAPAGLTDDAFIHQTPFKKSCLTFRVTLSVRVCVGLTLYGKC